MTVLEQLGDGDTSEDGVAPQKKQRFQIEDSSDEEEEDENEEDETMKDFIRDDVAEDEDCPGSGSDVDGTGHGDGPGGTGGSSRKRSLDSDDDDDDISEDDYALIEENLGVKLKKKRKRVQLDSDEEDHPEVTKAQDRDEVERTLFPDRDAEGAESEEGEIIEPQDAGDEESGDEEEESDVNDFIVDDEGQPISRKKSKKKRARSQIQDAALAEAQDVFGGVVDFESLCAQMALDGDEEDEAEDFDDEDQEERYDEDVFPIVPKVKVKKERVPERIVQFEPDHLEKSHCTEEDERIRKTDLPERFQTRAVAVEPLEEGELEPEAEWVFNQFLKPFVSHQDTSFPSDDEDLRLCVDSLRKRYVTMKQKIASVLTFVRDQKLDTPFLAFYRKEYLDDKDEPSIVPLRPVVGERPEDLRMTFYELCLVLKCDESWTQLRNRKRALQKLFSDMRNYLENVLSANGQKECFRVAEVRPLESSDITKLEAARSMTEVEDVYQHFLLHYGHYIPPMNVGRKMLEDAKLGIESDPAKDIQKRPVRKTKYAICVKNGLYKFANLFGLTPSQFTENVEEGYAKHVPNNFDRLPEDIAFDLIGDAFPNREAVIQAAVYMVAHQIAHEPEMRRKVRSVYEAHATIVTRATSKGIKEIDELHPCYGMKYLQPKPVKDLRGEAFLHLVEAERSRLITMSISLVGAAELMTQVSDASFLNFARGLYQSDGYSAISLAWNELRARAVKLAFEDILFPMFEKELRERLVQEARETVVKQACRKLHKWLAIAPYVDDKNLYEDEDQEDYDRGVRVVSIAYCEDLDSPSYAVWLDKNGLVKSYRRLPHFMRRRRNNPSDQALKLQDVNTLRDFIEVARPHAVAVCTSSLATIDVVKDVEGILSAVEDDGKLPSIPVELVDDNLAIVYQNSEQAQKDFPGYPPLLRQAISAGRRLQDPLVEFSQITNCDSDLLSLNLHPSQSMIPKEDLLDAINIEFIYRTNSVGVDINRALDYPHFSHLLKFVCGLGPRKASYLLKTLQQKSSKLCNRTELVVRLGMGPKVFINCAGFLKIDITALENITDTYLDPLDGTRIHPETYEWARKMAIDALEYDENVENASARALEEILDAPEKLNDLDLEAFANELVRQGYGNRLTSLYDIKTELAIKYKDPRTAHAAPSNVERFEMLTKQSPNDLYMGRLVLATVTGFSYRKPEAEDLESANPTRSEDTNLWKCPFCPIEDFHELEDIWRHFDGNECQGQPMSVRIKLDNGLPGHIPMRWLSDKPVVHPEERVRIGMSLYARVREVDTENFRIRCSSKSSDLIDEYGEMKPSRDVKYDELEEQRDMELLKKDKERRERSRTYVKRVIVHPNFLNATYQESLKKLEKMEQGDCLFRPSSKGTDNLTCTWKVDDGIYQHIDVLERNKQNDFSLGQILVIGNQEFEDLDEVIATHIRPMALLARELTTFKYYRKYKAEEVRKKDAELFQEKAANPTRIPYLVVPLHDQPGKFMLSYMPRMFPVTEYIRITPNGIRYRDQVFSNVFQLVTWFKVHFRDPIPGRQSATVGSSGLHSSGSFPSSARPVSNPSERGYLELCRSPQS